MGRQDHNAVRKERNKMKTKTKVQLNLRQPRSEGKAVRPHSFLTFQLDGGDLSPSSPSRFTPGKKNAFTDWPKGLVGSRAGLDASEKGITSAFLQGIKPRTVSHPRSYAEWSVPATFSLLLCSNTDDPPRVFLLAHRENPGRGKQFLLKHLLRYVWNIHRRKHTQSTSKTGSSNFVMVR